MWIVLLSCMCLTCTHISCTFAKQIYSEADKQYNQWNICELAY